jgi:hypothetical protein
VADRKWLRLWVITTNTLVVLILIVAAYGQYRDSIRLRTLLNAGGVPLQEVVRTNASRLCVICVLLVGIIAEMKRSWLSLFVNPGLYLVSFGWSLWAELNYHGPHPDERVIGRTLVLIPLGIIAAVTILLCLFYYKRAGVLPRTS